MRSFGRVTRTIRVYYKVATFFGERINLFKRGTSVNVGALLPQNRCAVLQIAPVSPRKGKYHRWGSSQPRSYPIHLKIMGTYHYMVLSFVMHLFRPFCCVCTFHAIDLLGGLKRYSREEHQSVSVVPQCLPHTCPWHAS